MKSMKWMVSALVLTLAAAVNAKTFEEEPWRWSQQDVEQKLGAPTWEMDVKWTRISSPVVEVREGTCFVYMAEVVERESSLEPMGALLKQCWEKGARVTNAQPIPGARRIRVHLVPATTDLFAVNRIYEKVAGNMTTVMVGRGISTRFVARKPVLMGGVYFDADADKGGACTVVGYLNKLGHEVKHCFDGGFHDNHWNWLSVPKK